MKGKIKKKEKLLNDLVDLIIHQFSLTTNFPITIFQLKTLQKHKFNYFLLVLNN